MRASNQTSRHSRSRAAFGHLMTLPTAWYEFARTGDLLARITTDTAIVQTVMTSTLSMAARNVILLVGGPVLVVLSSPKMSLVVLVVVPLVVVPLILLGRRLRRASRLAQDRLADVAVQAEETVAAIRTVQAFGRQLMMADRLEMAVDDSLEVALTRERLRGWMSGIVIFLVFSGISAILWIGGHDLLAGRILASDLSSFVFYAFLVAASTCFLSELAGELQRAPALPSALPRHCRQPTALPSRRRRFAVMPILPAASNPSISPTRRGWLGQPSARLISRCAAASVWPSSGQAGPAN